MLYYQINFYYYNRINSDVFLKYVIKYVLIKRFNSKFIFKNK